MSQAPDSGRFRTTRWSLVTATKGDSPDARRALGELCEAYWYPLYVRARRAGRDHDAAMDDVQGFVAVLLEGGRLEGAERGKGRFRAYLVAAMRNHGANVARGSQALKRDEGPIATLDGQEAAARYDGSAPSELAPDAAFERAWAEEVVAAARTRLAEEYDARGKSAVFEALADTLDGGPGARTHAERAESLSSSVGALKVAAHRMRQRMRELVRAEVRDTVGDAEEVDDELALLCEALGGRIGAKIR